YYICEHYSLVLMLTYINYTGYFDMLAFLEGGDSEKEEGGCALRSSRKKANVAFSDRSRPPPFLLFFPLTTRICQCIKSDVYSKHSSASFLKEAPLRQRNRL
ncbi:hypothetical protein, partial [Aneurinibacillus migulanus]|uniref:hypothetical protein n=1 Tax=Aneurinibacillus migulanus TaxID=47500 RepID=UPI001F15CB53